MLIIIQKVPNVRFFFFLLFSFQIYFYFVHYITSLSRSLCVLQSFNIYTNCNSFAIDFSLIGKIIIQSFYKIILIQFVKSNIGFRSIRIYIIFYNYSCHSSYLSWFSLLLIAIYVYICYLYRNKLTILTSLDFIPPSIFVLLVRTKTQQ